jgi:hypothetical protein
MTQNRHLLSQIVQLVVVGDMETAKEAMKLLTEPKPQQQQQQTEKPGGDFPKDPQQTP